MNEYRVRLRSAASRTLQVYAACAAQILVACASEVDPAATNSPQATTPVEQAPKGATAAGTSGSLATQGAAGAANGGKVGAAGASTTAAGGGASVGGAGAAATTAGAGTPANGGLAGSGGAGAYAAGAGASAAAGSSPTTDAGSSAVAGSLAAAGSGGAAAAEIDWTMREDLGKGDGKDVVTIGDSWMAGPLNGAGIQAGLDRAGTDYRHYAVTATTLLSGQIPGQYDSAKRADAKISTVIMTGGGNDVMFTAGSCSTPEACMEFTKKITAGLDELWTKMADDGVKDVIYVQYSDSAGSTPMENRSMSKTVVPICTTGRIYCHSIPTSDIISDADLADGIHPGSAGNDRIAKRILMLMETRKVRR